MPDPITLADVRAHIERRIQHCVEMIADVPHASGRYQRANAVRYELTEVLAMLQQIEQRNESALKELDKLGA